MFTFDFKLSTCDQNVCTVYLPSEDAVDVPVIIYCHGWDCNRKLYPTAKLLCDKAIKDGIAFVTFDFFGCGDTGGDYSQMTYTRWKNNLSEIVSWVISQSFSRKNKVGCFSVSAGTTIAMRLACEDQRLAFIISVATCISTHILMGDGGPAKLLADNLDSLVSGGTAKISGIDFGINFYLDIISNAPIYSMDKIHCPVLFLQGTADTVYRCADAKMAYDLMAHNSPQIKSTYIPLEGGNHGLDNVADKAVEKIFEWLIPILLA